MGFWPNRLAVLLAVSVAGAGGVYAVSSAPHQRLAPTRLTYTVSGTKVTGRAGADVRAVIVRLTRGGTVWAELNDGSFSARVPHGLRPVRLVVVLAGGSRQRLAVR